MIDVNKKKITLVKKRTSEVLPKESKDININAHVEVRKKRALATMQKTEDIESPDTSTNLRIHRIQAKSFKAFRSFDFKLDGRNLLAYGGNGAGKSSLYWLLYTILQSGQKETDDVVKYFDPNNLKRLLNVHANLNEQALANISISLHNSGQPDKTYTISATQHETKNVRDITKANLASDFVNYRVLLDFYRFRHSESINLWSVFENEILPFCFTPGSYNHLGEGWNEIIKEYDILLKATRPTGRAIASFEQRLEVFNNGLTEVLQTISVEAQKFYYKHFSQDDLVPISLIVGLTQASSFDTKTQKFDRPKIGFEVKSGEVKIDSPHTFLNEAKLTQLALSVRFGATLGHLRQAPLKLLVLDDLLISLDMSNRMKVVDIILGETFQDYQKIILTHDLGFFNEFRRHIGSKHITWSFQYFKNSSSQTGSVLNEAKSEIQKAEDYLHGNNLDEAAICLRKAAEDTAKRLREALSHEKLPPGKFLSLTDNLRNAKNKLLLSIPKQLYEKVLKGTSIELLQKLVPKSVADFDVEAGLQEAERGVIKSKRESLHKLLTNTHWAAMENVRLIDEVLETTERVLNPGAHGGESPLYEAEVTNALSLIRRLESIAQ